MEQDEETPEKKDNTPQEDVPKEQKEQQEQSRMGEYHWYETSITMPDVGDLDEGGKFSIEGRKIDLEGPNGRKELMNIVDDAVMQGGGDMESQRLHGQLSRHEHQEGDVQTCVGPREWIPQDYPDHGLHIPQLPAV